MIHDWNKINKIREDVQGKLPEDLQGPVEEIIGAFQGVIRKSYPPSNKPNSQYDEDYCIAQLLDPDKRKGTYVDVGAGEPRECSNTYALYRAGWRGVLIEPLPIFWSSILRQRPMDRLIPIAASDKNGWAKMLVQGTVSSLRPDWTPESQTQLWVETDTLDNLLTEQEKNCDLLSIDIEGHEAQALRGINWNKMRPKVVCVEFASYMTDEDLTAEWEPILLEQGYKLRNKTRLNKIYAVQD